MPAPRRRSLLSAALLCLVFTATSALAQTQADPEIASGFAPKPLVRAEKHMIVVAHPLAAEAGLRVLREGGSAVDAAIAAQLVLNVVEPQSSGIGGGGFALHWRASEGELFAWDGRERAPKAAKPDQFLDATGAPLPFMQAATSGLAIGTPALPRLLEAMHLNGGRLPWARLFEDAIRLAEQGFEVSPRLAASIARMTERLSADASARALLFTADGAPLPAGARLRQPALAVSLRLLATGGVAAFYKGPLAEEILRSVRAEPRPGALAQADLAAYHVVRRKPVCLRYRARFDVCGMGPPSSGGPTIAEILGLFAERPLGRSEARNAHRFLEASRLAYADRDRYLADPDFVRQPVAGLLDARYLRDRARLINTARASTETAEPGSPAAELKPAVSGAGRDRPGTTHLTVIDDQGDIVSMTSSIEIAFGSGRMAGGFFLNNQLTDFSFRPSKDGEPIANALAPGKRPRSSMAPTIVFDAQSDGRPVAALGSPGGSRIIEYVAWALIGMLDQGLSPAEAAARPHLSHRNRQTTLEPRADADSLAQELTARGHQIARREMTSGLHILRIQPDGALLGGADPRREGVALGD